MGISKKIDVIRVALVLLEKEIKRMMRIKRWKRAAKLVAANSDEINKIFRQHSKIKSE